MRRTELLQEVRKMRFGEACGGTKSGLLQAVETALGDSWTHACVNRAVACSGRWHDTRQVA